MRPILVAMACVNVCAAAIWIGSIYVELPQRYAMLWVAIAIGFHLQFTGLIIRLVWIFEFDYINSSGSTIFSMARRKVEENFLLLS